MDPLLEQVNLDRRDRKNRVYSVDCAIGASWRWPLGGNDRNRLQIRLDVHNVSVPASARGCPDLPIVAARSSMGVSLSFSYAPTRLKHGRHCNFVQECGVRRSKCRGHLWTTNVVCCAIFPLLLSVS